MFNMYVQIFSKTTDRLSQNLLRWGLKVCSNEYNILLQEKIVK